MKPSTVFANLILLLPSLAIASTRDEPSQAFLGLERSNDPDVPSFKPTFESPEHAWIGDRLVLRFPNSQIQGAEFAYDVNNNRLSFGDVIALAADYFYHWKLGACARSISDDWDQDPSRSRKTVADNVNLLRTDWEGFLQDVLQKIREQGDRVNAEVKKGKDIAKVYKDFANEYDNYFGWRMNGGYAIIALCNPDHFGKDAERAYSSVHDVALALAKEAAGTQNETMLKEAYFTEAYALHYLTDMFAAGHIRPPRRVLHSSSFDTNFMPGDRCTQKQHDEDGANGLWVTNKEGQSWSCYGDKQLAQGRSAKNRQMARFACQAGVDEIWDTFRTGNKPEPGSFRALRLTPLPELTFGPTNSVPLFQINRDKDALLYRENIDARENPRALKKLGLQLSNDEFSAIKKEIEAAGAAINMYVFTKAFKSDQRFLHLGPFDVTDAESKTVQIVANLYGRVDAGDEGQNWGMTAQGIFELPKPPKKLSWNSVKRIGTGVDIFSLVGTQAEGNSKYSAVHLGLSVKQDSKGQASITQVWSEQVTSASRADGCTEVIYGNFDRTADYNYMVKYFAGDGGTSQFEFWKLDVGNGAPPSKYASAIPTRKLNFLLAHKLASFDTHYTVVALAGGALSTHPSTWYFAHAENGTLITSTFVEPNKPRSQALLSHPNGILVRLSYGAAFPAQQAIQIEIVTPTRAEDGKVTVTVSKQQYDITWHGLIENDYLLWFLHDVDGDGALDLVAYCSDASHVFIDVVVFPGLKDSAFGKPVVSPITVDPNITSLFTGAFMTPIYTTQASYTYPESGGKTTTGAVHSFFNNYGIIGARVVVPKGDGSYVYVLGGQDGAIAGQRASTIGSRPQGWMGSNIAAQPLGIVAF